MDTKHVLSALAALAQESRLAVFRLLVQAGPEGLSPGKMSEQLGIPASRHGVPEALSRGRKRPEAALHSRDPS